MTEGPGVTGGAGASRTRRGPRRAIRAAPHVLIVDDNRALREVLAGFVRSLGCEVTEADSGTTAVTLASRRRPDAVCLDLWMDGVSGLDVLDQLRRDHPGLPVIIITADPFSDTMQEAQARGAVAYLAKPFNLEQLRSALVSAVGSWARPTRDS